MINTVVGGMLRVAGSIPELFRSITSDSLTAYTKAARVEPLTLIDVSIRDHAAMPDLMATMLNLFSGYYLQAIAISNTVGAINVTKQLDKLNPDRSFGDALVNTIDGVVSTEDYRYRLPNFKKRASLEWSQNAPERSSVAYGRDTMTNLRAVDNMAVGKVLEVQIIQGNQSAIIPVTIRLLPAAVSPEIFVSTCSIGSQKNTVVNRWHRFKAGELEFVRDLVLCTDLIDQHYSNLSKDKSGFYKQTVERRRQNKLAAIASGSPSVATASNIAIIAPATAAKLEVELGGRLKDYKIRQRAFEETSLMLLAVLDPEWERVVIYHRGIHTPSELSLRELKNASKGNGADIAEIMKTFLAQRPPLI